MFMFFCCIEGVVLVLDVPSLTSSHFVIFERFSIIVFAVSFWVFLFFSKFCALLHCIVFSVALLDGISLYAFWVPVLSMHKVLLPSLFFNITFYSQDLDCFRVNSRAGARVEISWFLFPFHF